jgi:hypothetical protein
VTIQNLPTTATEYDRLVRRERLAAIAAIRRQWAKMGDRFDESWAMIQPEVVAIMRVAQFRIAEKSIAFVPAVMSATGQDPTPREQVLVNPTEFPGYAGDGLDLEEALALAPIRAKQAVRGQVVEASYDALTGLHSPAAFIPGQPVAEALRTAGSWLTATTGTILSDTGRAAESAGMAVSRAGGYVRMLTPPSCSRCAILAGRFYRWNTGFKRHPGCDCKHIPSSESLAEDLRVDPYAYFNSLDRAEQDRYFTKSGAQAVRDGADLAQVVNARRGMTANKNFTTEGTTRQGNASRGLGPRQRRMTPESIYDQADKFGGNDPRGYALDRMREHGYILDAGQVPAGALRGQQEGFGQLGAGGQRRAASQAVLDARRTGVRNPNNRYTMTAAERRLYDAKRRYEVALSGRSPYTSPGFGNTPDPYGIGLNTGSASFRPVTKTELATARREYLAYLASRGQIFD